MKAITGLGLFWFCMIFMFKNAQEGGGEHIPSFIPMKDPDLCICFEYYFKDLSIADRTIYQSCDAEVLDYSDDSGMEVFTFSVPCDSIFDGTRILPPK